jgi:hypothetical protein
MTPYPAEPVEQAAFEVMTTLETGRFPPADVLKGPLP